MTYEDYLIIESDLDKKINESNNALKKFDRLPDGRHSDEVKRLPEYKKAKENFDFYFAQLRNLNKTNKDHVKKKGKAFLENRRKRTSI